MAGRSFGKKKEEDVTRVPLNLTGTFFGASIPDDVRLMVPVMHGEGAPSVEVLRAVIADVIGQLNAGEIALSSKIDADYIACQRKLGQQNNEDFGSIYSGIYNILRFSISSKANTSRIVADLKKMNLPPHVADDLGQATMRSRSELEKVFLHKRIRFPKLDKLRWRVDVVISSGSLSRVMRPSIMFQLILSDGKIETFECSLEQFHQVRHGVAKLLRDFQTIERHPIMRVAHELQKRENAEK